MSGLMLQNLLRAALPKATKTKALSELSRKEVRSAVKSIDENHPYIKEGFGGKLLRKELQYARNYGQGGGGKTDLDSMITSLLYKGTDEQAMTAPLIGKSQAFRKSKGKTIIATAGATLIGREAYDVLTDKEQEKLDAKVEETESDGERINPEDYPVYKKGTESSEAFTKAQIKAKKADEDDFEFEGREYNTKEKEAKNMGGMMKYNEGSMLVPPEMEAEMPVDTYDNIPEDEMEAAEASQLPDDKMEDGYLEFVLTESLETDDQEYLMSVLETDERLSSIFDKVMDVAGEFSGEGEVDGPGTGVSDSIPARLSDGEFVFTKKATDQMGADQLQTMMDEAEKAYDGGLMKKAFGGLTNDPMADEKGYMNEDGMTREAIKEQMINANRMPSVRK